MRRASCSTRSATSTSVSGAADWKLGARRSLGETKAPSSNRAWRATRLTVVVHYIEPEASSGASQALRNNFDSWIDASPFASGNAAGDYSAQQSNVDNTEIRILNSPTATSWRIKISPVTPAPFESIRVGISAVVTYGDTTPNTTLSLTAADYYVQPNENVDITAVYTNPSYIASAVYLDSTSSGNTLVAAYGNLVDGSSANWLNNEQSGRDICLGNVRHNSSRTANWTTRWEQKELRYTPRTELPEPRRLTERHSRRRRRLSRK